MERKQVGGNHYEGFAIEPIEFIVANNIPYREANAIKYICRHTMKNGLEDINKAIDYLLMLRNQYMEEAADENQYDLFKEAIEKGADR